MDFDIGTELLIQSPGNVWTPAFVEEDDGDEIFITYKDGNGANEWINKDSHRIKPMNEEWVSKLTKIPTHSENSLPDIKSIITNVPPTEKEISKKSTTSVPRSSSIFKVKFKKDDFLTKKTQDSKNKEQKVMKDAKKSSDRESKQLILCGTPSNEKHSHIVESSEMEDIKVAENIISSKTLKPLTETNLLRSENFEELLEDIEAEAEICSPTKSISRNDIKQKKKKKKSYFGQKRRSEKKKSKSKKCESKKKKLVVKLNPNNVKKVSTLPENSTLNHSDDKETSPPLKKLKPSLPISSPQENSINQSCSPLFQELANNTLLQKIRMDAANEQGLRCPKQECRKLFRKENLLMMHIKHYHSEYTELLVSTPNVTDLATARIEGENVDELSPSYFLHRISQLEAKRSWGNTSYETPLSSAMPSSLKLTEQEIINNTSLNSENYNTSFTSIDQPNNITQTYNSKDPGISGEVESFSSITETPIKQQQYVEIKEAIKNITLIDDFENETRDSYDMISIGGSDRHFKIKKNKSDVETLPKEEVINCSCASNQEDGLMIQCDICLCWQHGYCNKIDSEDQVPDNYICTSCLNPLKKRRSKQYDYSQDWIKEGTLASVLQHKDERRRKDEAILKQSHQLVAEVIEHNNYLHSLQVKTTIYGQTPDHPKLYLWSEQGSTRNEEPIQDKLEELLSGPVPEKPINISDCRKNLLVEIEDGFDNLEARINLFEAKTNGLEDQVNGCVDNEVLTNTVTLLLRDLNSINHHMSFENNNNNKEEETV